MCFSRANTSHMTRPGFHGLGCCRATFFWAGQTIPYIIGPAVNFTRLDSFSPSSIFLTFTQTSVHHSTISYSQLPHSLNQRFVFLNSQPTPQARHHQVHRGSSQQWRKIPDPVVLVVIINAPRPP